MMVGKLLNTPVPIVLGLFSQSIPGVGDLPAGAEAPQYMMGAFAGIFLVAYILKITGYMPHKNGKDAHPIDFTESDRASMTKMAVEVKKMTDLLASRDDNGFERFLKMNSRISEQGDMLRQIAEIQESQVASQKEMAIQLSAIARLQSRPK